jgi:hypothetical protein
MVVYPLPPPQDRNYNGEDHSVSLADDISNR